MNKMNDLFQALIINLFGYSLLIVPALAIYYDNLYAMYYSYGSYTLIFFYAISYMIGAIRCDKHVAMSIVFELKETTSFMSYVPVIAMLCVAGYAGYKQYYILPIFMITPVVLNFISRAILTSKATSNA